MFMVCAGYFDEPFTLQIIPRLSQPRIIGDNG